MTRSNPSNHNNQPRWQISLFTLLGIMTGLCVVFALFSALGFRDSTALLLLFLGTHLGVIGVALGRSGLAVSGAVAVVLSAVTMLLLDVLR